jgi:hypothetical protein
VRAGDGLATVGVSACGTAQEPVPFSYGTETFVGDGDAATTCDEFFERARIDQPSFRAVVPGAPGGRYRVYVIGDGVAQPLQALVQTQGVETTLGVITPSAAVDGLWFDPGDPGTGLAITFNAASTSGAQVQAIRFGFDAAGAPRWNTVAGGAGAMSSSQFEVSYYQYFGSPTQTGRQTRRVARGFGVLVFHSCTQATLYVGNDATQIFGPHAFPRDAVRLVKLLPLGGCSNPQFG